MTTLLVLAFALGGAALMGVRSGQVRFALANDATPGSAGTGGGGVRARPQDSEGAVQPSWTVFMRGL